MANFSTTTNFYNAPTTVTQNDLKNILAKEYDIKANQISLHNGRKDSLATLFKNIKEKNVFLYAPIETKYEKAALKAKKNVYHINRLHDPMQAPLEDSIVVFCNPSTPEGYHELEMAELLDAWIELECSIILDESYIEFEGLTSMRQKVSKYKKLYIVHSLSKFYACDGVKVSAIFAHKHTTVKLTKEIDTISSLDLAFLQQRILDKSFKEETLKQHSIQKEKLLEILTQSNLFEEIVESEVNFILTYSKKAQEIQKNLKKDGLKVYSCEKITYLSKEWLRFSVQGEEALQELQKALKD